MAHVAGTGADATPLSEPRPPPVAGVPAVSGAGSSTRRLLLRLRAASASGTLALPMLPALIAGELGAAVCSIYLVAPNGELVLKATTGLASDAVGVTRLRPGEGVVGLVVATGEPLNLADARRHPAFALRAETGELAFPSLLAVPIRRAGTVLGALVVQGEAARPFPDDDGEALATAAMLLAEVSSARRSLIEPAAPIPPRHFRGVPLSSGTVRGRIALGPGAGTPGVLGVADPEREEERLERAIARMQEDLDALLTSGRPDGDGAVADAARDVLDATRLLTRGTGWIRRVREGLGEGLSAEAAIDRVLSGLRRRMRALSDPLLRERLADLEDIGNALLVALAAEASDANAPLPPDTVLVLRRLGPAKLLYWHARGIAGLVIEEASPAGHAAILARSLDIPALGGMAGAVDAAEDGQEVILDADEGHLFLRPEPEIVGIYARQIGGRERLAAERARLRVLPDETADGAPFRLLLNAGLPQEVSQLDPTGAGGVGLFRTEIFVLARGAIPSVADQEGFYRRVLDRVGTRPIVFRTFDLGSDKMLHDAADGDEMNPAMGWRSLRVGLDEPEVLASQVRALLAASGGRPLRIMFPMVGTVAEFEHARAILDDERRRAGHEEVAVGAMLEVPALLFALPALFEATDFVSIGSNDLAQFLFAADRGTARVAGRYDLFAPAMLAAIDSVVVAARRSGKPLSLCGEIAGRPVEALTLLALGIGTLSMSPGAFSRVKAALRRADLGIAARALESGRRDGAGPAALRAMLADCLPVEASA